MQNCDVKEGSGKLESKLLLGFYFASLKFVQVKEFEVLQC